MADFVFWQVFCSFPWERTNYIDMIYIIFILVALASWLVSARLESKFKKYSRIPLRNGMTGKDVAEKMLRDSGITDVVVTSTSGHLTDHYNPMTKTVNLSESVYNSCSVAAAAVAAHECGKFCFAVGTMGNIGRRAVFQQLPAIVVGRHSFVCYHNIV